jgi:hypothetical protein
VELVTLSAVTFVLVLQGILPSFTLSKLRFGLIAGLFAGVLPQVALFWVSNHIAGVAISIALAVESLFVFSIAVALRIEKPIAVRLFGLLFGLLAVLIAMFCKGEAEDLGPSLWILAALIVPLSYAVEGILVASMPEEPTTTPFELPFFMMLGSSIWGWASLSGTVLNPLTAAPSTFALIATNGRAILFRIMRIAGLPEEGPIALVVSSRFHWRKEIGALLGGVYQLTQAEQDVERMLVAGQRQNPSPPRAAPAKARCAHR